MTTITQTSPVDKDTASDGASRPPESRPPGRSHGTAAAWIAVVVACILVVVLAVAAFTGGDDNVGTRTTSIDPQAEEHEREAHLEGQANTYGGDRGAGDPAEPGTTDPSAADDEFVPGTRHMPTR